MVAQRGTATSATASNATSVTATKPTGVLAGDLLLAVFANADQATTMPSGWTQLFYDTANATTGHTWGAGVHYKIATASEPTNYTFSVASSAPLVLTLTAWSGVDPTTPIGTNYAEVASAALTEPHTGPTATVSVANGRMVYLRSVRFAGSTPATYTTASGTVSELVDVGVFSGGSVSYSTAMWADLADFTSSGSKTGLATSASAAESDNLEATIALKSNILPSTATVTATLPKASVSLSGSLHFDAVLAATLPSLTSAWTGAGQPVVGSATVSVTLPKLSSSLAGAEVAFGAISANVLPSVSIFGETRVFGSRVITIEEDDRTIPVLSRAADD